MTNCILHDMWYVPEDRLPPASVIKNTMKVQPVWFRTFNQPKPKPIAQCCFEEKGYVGFPIYYGMKMHPDPDFINETSAGSEFTVSRFPDPYHEYASSGQPEFMDALIEHFKDNVVGLAKAGTGTGKTVCALNLAARRGRSTLVITDREHLSFDQWIPEAVEHLGLSDSQIGIVQGKKCEYDKPFVAAIAKSLIEREYDPEFYSAFGTVILDELDVFGTQRMYQIMCMFNAECRLGMTATEKRADNAHKLYLDYYGPPRIVAKGDALPFQLKIVDYYDRGGGKMPSNPGVRRQRLASDDERNRLIVREIINLYNDGRQILVLGDDIRHLQRLEEMCWKQGIPEDETGQFSRERYIFTKHPGEHKGEKVTIKKMKKSRVTSDYLAWVKKHATIVFATRGMMKRGTNIPRLDAGIDAMPRMEATQEVGRIRRPFKDKRIPLWVTIRDRSHDCFMRAFKARMRDYIQEKAEILNG